MNGVHDMGGMHGFGPVIREKNEPVFHAAWEGRIWAISRLTRSAGLINSDESRFGIEQMDPAEYLRASYYERRLVTVEYNLVDKGVLSEEEIDARMRLLEKQPETALPSAPDVTPAPPPAPKDTESPPTPEPRFAVGDEVITRNVHPHGHTRLPRYARSKRGVIRYIHGPATFPDTNAHGLGKNPHMLYGVQFDGQELWGDSTEAPQLVHLDLWESYLEPA